MQIQSAEDLFNHELWDIYAAEQKLSDCLPRLSQAVQTDSVRQRLDERLNQGKTLIQAMDKLFSDLNIPKQQWQNAAIDGLVDETEQVIGEIQDGDIKDCAVIGAVQKIEHYCIASWGNAKALGRQLGRQPAVDTFQRVLDEGKQFDKNMSELAEKQINPAATQH